MPNITLTVDEEIIKKVRKYAIDRNTTMTALVRDYLKSVADMDEISKDIAVNRLKESFTRYGRNMGEKRWKREDLYDR